MARITTSHQFSKNVEKAFAEALKEFDADMMLVDVKMQSGRNNKYEASLDILINNDRYTFSGETSDTDLYNKYDAISFGDSYADDLVLSIIETVFNNKEVYKEINQLV